MPRVKLTNKQRAAKQRFKVAIAHVLKAENELRDACADISTIEGAMDLYKLVKGTFFNAGVARRKLTDAMDDDRNMPDVDHEPTPQEVHCGHGPKHGCGKGKR